MSLREDISDKTLVDRYKESRDQKHLSILFERYKTMIFGVCLKYFKDVEDARDGTMEIYEKSVSKVLSHEVENFRSWVYVMTKNHCLGKIRKNKTQELKESELNRMYSEQDWHPDSIQEKKMVKLEECMEKLMPQQNQCIKAFYYKKLSYHQIAEHLDMSWNSVRSYIQNARRRLKQCIEQS